MMGVRPADAVAHLAATAVRAHGVGDRFEYDATADDLAAHADRLAARGIDLVGGCCGSTPAHIASMASVLAAR
jgi:5-methyltetrahydrofolate--homocysteine methyltransferase